jgi:hypothetical protein
MNNLPDLEKVWINLCHGKYKNCKDPQKIIIQECKVKKENSRVFKIYFLQFKGTDIALKERLLKRPGPGNPLYPCLRNVFPSENIYEDYFHILRSDCA